MALFHQMSEVLAPGTIDHFHVLFAELVIFCIANDANDFGLATSPGLNMFANRVLLAEIIPGKRLVDDGHPRRGFVVPRLEFTPSEQSHPNRLEKLWPDQIPGDKVVIGRARPIPFNDNRAAIIDVAQQPSGRNAGRAHTWQLVKLLLYGFVEVGKHRAHATGLPGRCPDKQYMLAVMAEVDGFQISERAHEQPRADEEQQ